MSVLGSMNFNASEVEPATGFEPIPEGTYTLMVDKAEEKPTRNGGVQLVLQLRVVEGKYAKRTLFHRINLQHPTSPKCVEIGRAQLSGFCRATGVMTPRLPHEFANRTCIAHVTVAQRGDGKGLTNEIAKFEPTGSAVQGLVQDGSSKNSQPAAGPAPWAKTA